MHVVFVYFQPFRCNLLFKCSSQHKTQKKSLINPLFWVSRLFKVTDFGVDQKDLWDFLWLINSKFWPFLHRFDTVAEYDGQEDRATDTHSETDASTTSKMREALHTVTRQKLCAVLNFARFDSLLCTVARSWEKSHSLSLVPFLACYRSFSLSLTGLVRLSDTTNGAWYVHWHRLLRGCQTNVKVGWLLRAWFSCLTKSVNHDWWSILSSATSYDIR